MAAKIKRKLLRKHVVRSIDYGRFFFLQRSEVVTVGGGDVDLVEMHIFHISASFSLQKQKKPRENKKKSRYYMATPLAPCSLWGFVFFFVFSIFFVFDPKCQKPRENKKKTLDTIWLPPWPHVVRGGFFFPRGSVCFWKSNAFLKDHILLEWNVY